LFFSSLVSPLLACNRDALSFPCRRSAMPRCARTPSGLCCQRNHVCSFEPIALSRQIDFSFPNETSLAKAELLCHRAPDNRCLFVHSAVLQSCIEYSICRKVICCFNSPRALLAKDRIAVEFILSSRRRVRQSIAFLPLVSLSRSTSSSSN
jgi:hypothetical protein